MPTKKTTTPGEADCTYCEEVINKLNFVKRELTERIYEEIDILYSYVKAQSVEEEITTINDYVSELLFVSELVKALEVTQ